MPILTKNIPPKEGFLFTLWNAEIPTFTAEGTRKHSILAPLFTFFLAFAVVASLMTTLHNDALFLGPGLGLAADTKPVIEFYHYLNEVYGGLGFALIALAVFSSIFIMTFTTLSYFLHKKTFGVDYPLREHFTFPTIAIVERIFFALSLGTLGLIAWSMGFAFDDGVNLIYHWATATNDWVNATVPTLVELPYVVAFFISYGIAGFVHYGLHRFSHVSRFFWLLFHRFHHMPTVMFPASVPPVFFSIPLFLFVVIPYHLAFGMLTKLFCDQPLYFALIIYKLLYYLSDIWAHNTAMYQLGRKNKLIRAASFFFSNGIYHYIHHSSEKMDGNSTNMVNLGGSFLYLPDIIFGTFRTVPDEAPAVGLTNQPTLHYNPFRLAFSGMAQYCYELWHNRSLKEWFYIFFGSVDYVPPKSKNYALKAEY